MNKRPPSLTARRKMLRAATAEILSGTIKSEARVKLGEALIDMGLEVIGRELRIDHANAMVLFPDDPVLRLLHALSAHATAQKVDFEDAIDALLLKLHAQPTMALSWN